ncbi:MAG: hypothetical protein D6725_11010 [Planctomycetota bacterium]|nr:MAG: hypothetical protein D6725_11010 [Planctomycetota bacterium]
MAVAALHVAGLMAASEDRLVLQLRGSGSRVAVRGEVLDRTADFVEFRLAVNKEVKRYPVDQVVAILTTRVQPHSRGVSLMKQGLYRAAVEPLQAALKTENRRWMRREVLADLIRCHLEIGDDVAAAELFDALVRADSDILHWKLAPLRWSPTPLTAAEATFASEALEADSEVLRLIAASWLWQDPARRMAAERVLEALLRSGDDRVQMLARVQLWRRDLRQGEITDLRIRHWERTAQRIPIPLRRGPWLLVARARRLRRENDLAAATLLWIPSAFPEPRRWAADAIFQAAEALREAGDAASAGRLYREVAAEYGETPAGELAARKFGPSPQPGVSDTDVRSAD